MAKKVPAEGSIWRLHFEVGQTPTEREIRELTGALKATIIVKPGKIPSKITPQGK